MTGTESLFIHNDCSYTINPRKEKMRDARHLGAASPWTEATVWQPEIDRGVEPAAIGSRLSARDDAFDHSPRIAGIGSPSLGGLRIAVLDSVCLPVRRPSRPQAEA
jgi:hypothetical protein